MFQVSDVALMNIGAASATAVFAAATGSYEAMFRILAGVTVPIGGYRANTNK